MEHQRRIPWGALSPPWYAQVISRFLWSQTPHLFTWLILLQFLHYTIFCQNGISPVPFGFRNHCFFIDLPPRITTPEFPASSAKFPSTLPYCYFLSKWRNNSLSTVQLHLSSSYLSQTHGILELIWKNFCFSYSLCDLFMWIITFES